MHCSTGIQSSSSWRCSPRSLVSRECLRTTLPCVNASKFGMQESVYNLLSACQSSSWCRCPQGKHQRGKDICTALPYVSASIYVLQQSNARSAQEASEKSKQQLLELLARTEEQQRQLHYLVLQIYGINASRLGLRGGNAQA